jgi:16S rRNA (cytidine1402-2'-O)-methyltransferase
VQGKLILVGTPIGNLGDFSPRGVAALGECDFIAAEDTRVSVKLLNHFGIKKPLLSYYEHNRIRRGEEIRQRILSGETCVLVSDAGMPVISDPGEELVAECARCGIEVSVVPGPNAAVSALAISGLRGGRFTFEGFLSMNKKSRRAHLESLVSEQRTMIFYEAPHKLRATLADLLGALGERNIAIVRELTKLHEEAIRTTLGKAVERYAEENPKGEIVLIVEGAEVVEAPEFTLEEAVQLALEYTEQGLTVSEAARKAAHTSGIKKSDIYKELISEREE